MKAYSQDLREKVLRAVDQGKARRGIVSMFGVSLATLKRYLKQRRETGSLLPKPIPGRPPKKCAPLEAGIVSQLKAHADVTLEEHCRLWEASTGMPVSTILTHNLGYVLLHSPLAGKTGMNVRRGTERVKRPVARNG